MAVSGIIFQMITLFIMMFAGYLAARAGLISPSFRRGLSSLVLSTAFPCCIVSSVLQSGGAPGDMVVALGVSVAFFALMIALAAVLVCIVPTPKPERSLDQLMLVFTNLAFMGIPIIQVFYGAQGVAMLSMFLLVFNFLVFTYGVMLVSGNGSINLRQLVNPGVVSALIALLFGLTGWRLPSPVSREPAAPDRHAAGLYRPRARRSDQPHACGHLRDRRRHADCRKLQHAFRYLYAGGYDRLSRDHRFHPAQRRDPAAARRRDEYGGAGIMKPAP